MNFKDISLYIPCYNAAPFLAMVVGGVLEQSWPLREVLIIDDGSTDGTARLAEALGEGSIYPLRVIRHGHNLGLGAARNTGVREARGALVASVDADVIPASDWLEKLVMEMQKSNAAGVGGNLIESNLTRLSDRWRTVHMSQTWGEYRRENPPFLYGSNTLFHRHVLLKAGLYDIRCRTNAEDVKLCEKIRDSHKLIYTPLGRCIHLRKDRLSDVLNIFWKWHWYGNYSPVSLKLTFDSNRRHLTRILRLLRVDIFKRDVPIVMVDLAMFFYGICADWKAFSSKKLSAKSMIKIS